jgi:hypothetical protein
LPACLTRSSVAAEADGPTVSAIKTAARPMIVKLELQPRLR